MTDLTAETPPRLSESLWWSYFKAMVAGFAGGLAASALLSGASFLHTVKDMAFHHIAGAVVMLTLAPALAVPIRLLADLARRLGLARGASDIAIGALIGAAMLLPELSRGAMPGPAGWGFVLGGGFGGFMFWRARGYPGRDGRLRTLREALDEAAEATRAALGRG